MISVFRLLMASIFFFKLIISIVCSLNDSQNFFTQSLSCLFYILLNDDIADIEKLNGICLLTFTVDKFSGLFLHPSIFFIKHSRTA